MKNWCLLMLIVFVSSCIAQQKTNGTHSLAKVRDWNKTSYIVDAAFWDSSRTDIVNQIGNDGFEKVKSFSAQNAPVTFRIWDGNYNHERISIDEYYKRLGSLKMYKYIPFSRTNFKGEKVKYWILSLPYQELYWDKVTVWDTIYFLIKEGAVE